jgi:carboxypeptidase Taq
MLDLYERDMTVSVLDKVFEIVKSDLVPIATQVSKNAAKEAKFMKDLYPSQAQWDFSIQVLKNMGYDFTRGRQDKSVHPFTISFGPSDVRVTTRVDEKDFANLLWSSIHEGGHALYEQGLNEKDFGLFSGSAASLSIHESQSRIWENNVGRGKPFWEYHLPLLKKKFPSQLKGINLSTFLENINHVKSNKIRTEADELHYHLHVLIRYEIEKEIFSSTMNAKDVKSLWNELYKKYLGQTIKKDSEGILQDVHWSHGSFGYFPTYSLGSFYAAQFYTAMLKDHPTLESEISSGNMSNVNKWLAKNIYKHGGIFTSEEICKKATGKGLDINYFKNYAINKFVK